MKYQQNPVTGFTPKASARSLVLKNDIGVAEAHDPATGPPFPDRRTYIGIWDTGATGTVITRRIVSDLGLQPSGQATVQGVGSGDIPSIHQVPTYLVNLYLPNNVTIMGVPVVEGHLGGTDMLLGMDIIGFGDFACL